MDQIKKLMSWSLRVTASDYRHDYERYGNKITSIGLHEWDIDGEGKISMYKPLPQTNKSNGIYIPGIWVDATTHDRYARNQWDTGYLNSVFPVYIEPDMKRWPHIEYYMQFVLFTPEVNSKIFDSQAVQDNLIANMKTVVSRFRKDKNGVDLGYTGIEIDCEGSFSDSKWDVRSGDDDKYIALLKRIKNEVIIDSNPDFKLRVNAHAMWGDGVPDYFRFNNYKLFADSVDKQGKKLIDEIQLMSYDFAWNGSAPGPSTPLVWLESIAQWCRENFDPQYNPNAKLTIDHVYLGGAGYGRRWPIYDEDTFGSSVTYRNLVDWQNGYYAHLGHDGVTMADQDFIPVNAFNDPVSDNQIMYPHVYDYLKARHLIMPESMGQTTARASSYNGIEFATAYSKNQHATFTGVRAIAGEKQIKSADGKVILYQGSEPADTNGVQAFEDGDIKLSQTATMDINGQEYTFQAYRTVKRPWKPLNGVCQISEQPETVLTYKVNVASAGSYNLVAIVSFPFFGQSKLGGHVNGSTAFTIGGDNAPDYYPMMIKGVHVWDMGNFSLNAGDNTITIEGPLCEHGTVIFGFIVCDSCTTEVIGGYMNGSPTIQAYKKRDGSPAKLPNGLAFTNEVLQQAPRPVIMWEDYLKQWLTDKQVQGTNPDGSKMTEEQKTVKNSGLQSTTYYQVRKDNGNDGSGTTLKYDADQGKDVCVDPNYYGYSLGFWDVIEDADKNVVAHFKPGDPRGGGLGYGQLMLNYKFRVTNISAEVQFSVASGDKVGIRFSSSGVGDGYIFWIDYKAQKIGVFDETNNEYVGPGMVSLNDRAVAYGDRITLNMMVNNGQGKFTIGGINLLGTLSLPNMKQGSMGFYSSNAEVNLFMLSLRTTEKWETLERFELIVDGQSSGVLGEFSRPGITRDQWGFLNYSGLNEFNTREVYTDEQGNPYRKEISLDYVFKPVYFPTIPGKKNVQIKLIDAGLWYKMLYIGDQEGMSITYAGDNESFNRAMNLAVYDYGCKGIGLWVLGQADPRLYETLPDVVPWHPKP